MTRAVAEVCISNVFFKHILSSTMVLQCLIRANYFTESGPDLIPNCRGTGNFHCTHCDCGLWQ
jgi:hypothetical protein